MLIGGFAVFLYGYRRLTQDVDIVLKMIPENLEKFREALFELYEDNCINEITYQELKEYAVIRYGTPGGIQIDIISNLGEYADYNDLDWEILAVQDVKIKIATPESLYKLKKDTVRPQDKIDAHYLYELMQRRKNEKG